ASRSRARSSTSGPSGTARWRTCERSRRGRTPSSILAGRPASIPAMEAASKPRDLAGDKAHRIVDAMRASVARRGAAGSTFDHVAREAGVSRGLLHYYFGTKERLLAEVVRRETAIRLPLLRDRLDRAKSADEILQALVANLEDSIQNDPGFW